MLSRNEWDYRISSHLSRTAGAQAESLLGTFMNCLLELLYNYIDWTESTEFPRRQRRAVERGRIYVAPGARDRIGYNVSGQG